ncbi:MAG TPA: hypothetical protein PKJ41_00025 [Bryobacteraceae bacterium]|nr:hypothetical protein [Bryobacteraceae bacterium]
MFLCLISPILLFSLRSKGFGLLAVVLIALSWLSGLIVGDDMGFQSTIAYSLAFFCFGGYMSIHAVDLRILDRWWLGLSVTWLLFGVGLCIYCCRTENGVLPPDWAIRCSRILGCVALWTLFSQVRRSENVTALFLMSSPFSFYVFSIHYPFILMPMHQLHLIARSSGSFWVSVYVIAAPLLAISIGGGSALLLRRYSPAIYSVLSGQRGAVVGGRGKVPGRSNELASSSGLRH